MHKLNYVQFVIHFETFLEEKSKDNSFILDFDDIVE